MTEDHMPENKLKQEFEVLGHFYSIEIPGIGLQQCRDTLEIRSRTGFESGLPDAVFVMMNPGSSKPISGRYDLLTLDEIAKTKSELIQAEPDTTQYQAMRVMHCSGWKHVRVINLSDLHETSSGDFIKRYKSLEGQHGIISHSVFSPSRSHQLRRHTSRKAGAPIILAWGVSTGLNGLTTRAINALADESGVVGWARDGSRTRYYHPLPRPLYKQTIWVEKILNILSGNNPPTMPQPVDLD